MSSTFGTLYRIHSFGESHGPGVGVLIDGCPPGIRLDLENIKRQLQRRRPGQSSLSSQRQEKDEFEILSGLYQGKTLGSPIAVLVRNQDVRSKDYEDWAHIYRPSHADYTYHAKYGYRTHEGGGRASARESIARVIAGAIAGQILKEELRIESLAWVDGVGEVEAGLWDQLPRKMEEIEGSIVRCPDEKAAKKMIELIEKVRKAGDSLGGTVGLVVWNVPPGLGEPVFGKLEAKLGQACLSIPACKGFISGNALSGRQQKGSEYNDLFYNPFLEEGDKKAKKKKEVQDPSQSNPYAHLPSLSTRTNHSGGIQGGISNGMPIVLQAIFKPTATIFHPQESVNERGESEILQAKGRHDPCVLPRAVPIVEAMANLVLLDAYLIQRAQNPKWGQHHKLASLGREVS